MLEDKYDFDKPENSRIADSRLSVDNLLEIAKDRAEGANMNQQLRFYYDEKSYRLTPTPNAPLKFGWTEYLPDNTVMLIEVYDAVNKIREGNLTPIKEEQYKNMLRSEYNRQGFELITDIDIPFN